MGDHPGPISSHGATDDGLHGWLGSLCEAWQQPGLSVAIVRGGQPWCSLGVGAALRQQSRTVDADTLFAAGSISKTFAAATVGVLVDAGEIGFDDPVLRYLPSFELSDRAVTRAVTIRDLLANRVGVESSEGRHRRAAHSNRDLIRRMARQRFRHEFRHGFGYCSDTFTCVGAIVEEVTGTDWESFARQSIWQPLAMHRTNANHHAARSDPNSAAPHLFYGSPGIPIPAQWAYEERAATPAGGVNSSANDLALWICTLLGGGRLQGVRVLQEQTVRALFEPQTPEIGPYRDDEFACVLGHGEAGVQDPAYGMGWYRHRYQGETVCYHTGAIDGFRSILGLVPDKGVGIVVLANADNHFLPRAVFQSLLDAELGLPEVDWSQRFLTHQSQLTLHSPRASAATASPEAQPCPVPLAQLCGDYLDETGFGKGTVALEDDSLVLTVGEVSYRLVHTNGLCFAASYRPPYAPTQPFSVEWSLAAGGETERFVSTQRACFVRR